MNASTTRHQINSTANSENKSKMNEENKMTNENTNIQDLLLNTGKSVNTGNPGYLTIKNSMRLLGGLALAGMVAMATTFGSVSADSPSVTTSFSISGPYEMDVDFLNNLGNTHFNLGPDGGTQTSASANISNGPDVVEQTASAYINHGPDVVEQTASAYISNGPDVVEQTAIAYISNGPDVVEQTASAYISNGPDVVEQASAFLYNFHGPDTTEWIG